MKNKQRKFYSWAKHRQELMRNSEFQQAVKELQPEFEAAQAMIQTRIKYALTQKELAKKMNTKQSVISRVENMQTTPSLSFLKRFAHVFGGRISLRFSGI